MSNTPKILIIDDDKAVCAGIRLLLEKQGYITESLHLPSGIEDTMINFRPDLIILDMNFTVDTSGKQGLLALEKIQHIQKNIPVILMTGWATVQLAVEGMKRGAVDFLAKPWDNNHLLDSVKTIFDIRKPNPYTPQHDALIIGKSEKLSDIISQAKHVAATDASVLITGESGTGKELLAEMIHYHSRRKDQSFVKVNLGGISASLFESEMFGHKKGAFTGAVSDRTGRFALADKGTIFLDEIGDLDLTSQVKLLRVLQEKTYEVLGSSTPKKTDCRVISATNRNLMDMIYQGSFREDLFYRVNLIHLHLPSLSERKEDVPLLIRFFTDKTCVLYGLPPVSFSEDSVSFLCQKEYPGNIRQLKNVVERCILLNSTKDILQPKDVEKIFNANPKVTEKLNLPEVGQVTLEELEILMIKKAFDFHQKSVAKTAAALGITRSSLYRRLEKHNIPYEF